MLWQRGRAQEAVRWPHPTCMDSTIRPSNDDAQLSTNSANTSGMDGRAPEDEGKANAMLHILTKQHMNMRNDQTQTHITQPSLPLPHPPLTQHPCYTGVKQQRTFVSFFFQKKKNPVLTRRFFCSFSFIYLHWVWPLRLEGTRRGPGFPEGLLLSLPLFSCKNCQSLTSAAGLLIGSAATRRSLIGHRAQCAIRASLLPSLLHTGNAAMQRRLPVPGCCQWTELPLGSPLSDQTSAASAAFCWMCELKRSALNTHQIPSLPKALGAARRPFCTNTLSLSLSRSLFPCAQTEHIRAHARTHTRTHSRRRIDCRRSHMLLLVGFFFLDVVGVQQRPRHTKQRQ